jgi:hypothetical protein
LEWVREKSRSSDREFAVKRQREDKALYDTMEGDPGTPGHDKIGSTGYSRRNDHNETSANTYCRSECETFLRDKITMPSQSAHLFDADCTR